MMLGLTLLILAALWAFSTEKARAEKAPALPLKVMSYNIRCLSVEQDFRDLWWFRRGHLAELIRQNQPDLIGMQEVYTLQANDLSRLLKGYAWFGPPRDDGLKKGERCPIFYRADRFELLDQNAFWLSETPEVPGSISWDAGCRRVVTWGKFRDKKAGKVFFHFNTHFDNKGELAREKSAGILVERIRAIAGDAPVVVTGDFNTSDSSAPYLTIAGALCDCQGNSSTPPKGPHNTSWSFKSGFQPDDRIDYIFVSQGIAVSDYAALDHTYGRDRRPSDHIPLAATIIIP